MTDYLQLFFFVVVLALASSYIAWCKVRVFFVRQELFGVSDTLWDVAQTLKAFDDPAYVEARSNLNTMIRFAHTVNLHVLLYMISEFPHERKLTKSTSSELQAAIDEAIKDASWILAKYVILYRPFLALFFVVKLMITLRTRKIINAIRDKINYWMNGGGPSHPESLACH